MSYARVPAIEYAHANQQRFLNELVDFSSIPSISTDPKAKPDMQRAANWVADRLKQLGMKNVRILSTQLHPAIFAELKSSKTQSPTLLIYGHYDVQPAEPLELWKSDAFAPTVRGEHLYGRGVADMKGQVLATIDALEAIMKTGDLPFNVKFLIEGEEEIGSPSLAELMTTHKDIFACDLALNPDSSILAIDQPSITYALRGLAYFEIRVYGPDQDLHSGVFGGSILNPAQALCELIAGMHNANGSITLPGFYDRVEVVSAEERAELANLPLTDNWFLNNTGVSELWGEKGFSSIERVGTRPTLEVNGLYSGFTGQGSKTVLPAWAMAKISCRLVPYQDPEEVHQQLLAYLHAKAPNAVRWEVEQMVGGPAYLTGRDSKGVKALADAMQTTWGKRPLFKREGGSVPVVTHFQNILGVDAVNTGFSTPADNTHGPNEKLHLPTWYRGIDTLLHFYLNFAEV